MRFSPNALAAFCVIATAAAPHAAVPYSADVPLRDDPPALVPESAPRGEAIPLSAWLDFTAIASAGHAPGPLPIWIESVERVESPSSLDVLGSPGSSACIAWRIRLRPLDGLLDEILVRLTFEDRPRSRPSVLVWSETGELLFDSGPLGTGAGLPVSESVAVSLHRAAIIEIESPGSGTGLLGAWFSPIRSQTVQALPEVSSSKGIADPFHLSTARANDGPDLTLLDRTRAMIDPDPVTLLPSAGASIEYAFLLGAAPSVAVIRCQIANADILFPPRATINGTDLGPATLFLPDLADPAYAAKPYALSPSKRFRYRGWADAQIAVPGHLLRPGENLLVVRPGDRADAISIRRLEIELKSP